MSAPIFAAAALAVVAARAPPPEAAAGTGWPCETAPRPTLQLADVWPGAPGLGTNWRDDPAVAAVVEAVAPRSVALSDATARLRALAAEASPRTMAAVAAGLVDSIDSERRQIIAGIRRFNRRQEDIATRIQQSYAEADKPPPPASDTAASEARGRN